MGWLVFWEAVFANCGFWLEDEKRQQVLLCTSTDLLYFVHRIIKYHTIPNISLHLERFRMGAQSNREYIPQQYSIKVNVWFVSFASDDLN